MFESLDSKLKAIRKGNIEWISKPLDNSVLFEEDQTKINNAVVRYPMGSHQIGTIAELSSLLYERGVDVTSILISLCKTYGISTQESE